MRSPIVGSRVLLLDPGHGGRAPGCVHPQPPEDPVLFEKDVALALCLAFQPILKAAGFIVFLSRSIDQDFTAGPWKTDNDDLRARISACNRIQADALLSIHLDSLAAQPGLKPPSGFTAYYAQTSQESFRLATTLYAPLIPLPPRDRGVRSDLASRNRRLGILRDTRPPAALLELGFLSNPDDREWIQDPANQDRVGRALAEGFNAYFA